MTGRQGMKHTDLMLQAGTNIVGGVNARKAGNIVTIGKKKLPVFVNVQEAKKQVAANASIVFVPPQFAKAAIIEAIEAEIDLLIIITEGIPIQDMVYAWEYNLSKGNKTRIVGPNCPGVIAPGIALAGIIPNNLTNSGPIGLVSKSGTLTYQMMQELQAIGISTAVGIGGDPVVGTTLVDVLAAFEKDPDTKAIVMIGEIGGEAEEQAAEYIKQSVTKPVFSYIAGFMAPVGKTMGHAGAIISGTAGTARAKQAALAAAGVVVGKTPSITAQLVIKYFNNLRGGNCAITSEKKH